MEPDVRYVLMVLLIATVAEGSRVGAYRAVQSAGLRMATGELWTPADLDGLAAWYDASDASTITASSNDVTEWRDKSENDHHLVTNAGTPKTGTRTFNGVNVIAFDGSSDLLNTSFAIDSENISIAIVRAFDGTADLLSTFSVQRNTESQGRLHEQNFNNITQFGYRRPENRSITTSANTNISARAYVKSSTSLQSLWGDGNLIGSNGNTVTTWTSQRLWMGSSYSATAAERLIGAIGEFVLIDAALSEFDRQKLEGYLAHKWGLAGNLPANHPYRNNPPTK
jgi:hypothetical protein